MPVFDARFVDARLVDALEQLAAAGLLFRRGTPPRASFVFKHALVQDAAYGTLLRGLRRRLHGRIGQALQTLDIAETQPEALKVNPNSTPARFPRDSMPSGWV